MPALLAETEDACRRLAPSDPLCVCVSQAIFENDSNFGSAGVAAKTNNPGNMRCTDSSYVDTECWNSINSNGRFSLFSDMSSGVTGAVDLYVRLYAGKLPSDVTRMWAGNPQSKGYWTSIEACYNSLL